MLCKDFLSASRVKMLQSGVMRTTSLVNLYNHEFEISVQICYPDLTRGLLNSWGKIRD